MSSRSRRATLRRAELETAPASTGAGNKVMIAWIHPADVSAYFCTSMINLLMADQGRTVAGYLHMLSGPRLSLARNQVAAHFLDGGEADWLLMVDSDMAFEQTSLSELLESADAIERPIVGGLCFMAGDALDGNGMRAQPVILRWADGRALVPDHNYPRGAMVQCDATGTGFLLVHRRVFEAIHERGFSQSYPWFQETEQDGVGPLGEDVTFCLRAGELGFPVFVNTAVRIGHAKVAVVDEAMYMRERAPVPLVDLDELARKLQASIGGGVAAAPTPPASAPTAVIVPVLRRPQNAGPFMQSLRATTGLATVYAVANHDDPETVRAWEEAGATILYAEGISFASKVNAGYAQTSEPWLFITGDDVRFHPGWLDHVQAAAGSEAGGQDVVGTNDLGNPRVIRGEHATHMLIRRRYVDEVGASWDGPGSVCHEGYRHWFVDDEIVTAARSRATFAFAPGAIVEHLHPLWGKGETDEVYELGRASEATDRALFAARLAGAGVSGGSS